MTELIYAGVGSRKTPDDILELMREIAAGLEQSGFLLRSGGATGADIAFEDAVEQDHMKQICLPWKGYNDRKGVYRFSSGEAKKAAYGMAEFVHPNWDVCGDGVRKLHARNAMILFGPSMGMKVDFVVCWTEGGHDTGGTGQTIRMAHHNNIPVFNLGSPDLDETLKQMENFVNDRLETVAKFENMEKSIQESEYDTYLWASH